MANNVAITEDHQVEVTISGKTERYDLNQTLSENALIVKQEKSDILHQMDLDSVITNLDNSVDLLNVSYHAVYGFKVQAKIFGLQKRLMDLNDKGILVIQNFKDKSAVIMADLKSIFHWLTKCKESIAIGKLMKFAQYAAGMSEQAEELANDYEKMADDTSSVLQQTMDESNAQYEKGDKLREMLAEFEAQQASADTAQKSIEARLKTLRADYDKLLKAEEKEESRKNTQAILGTVFSALGGAVSLVGNTVGSLAGSITGGDKSGSEGKNANKEELDKNNAKKEELDAQIQKLDDEIANLEKSISEKTEEKDAAEDEEKKKALTDEISKLREQVREKQEDKKKTEKDLKTVSSTIEKLGKLFSEVGGQLGNTQSDDSVSQQRSIRMTEIYNELIKLEEENTKQLAQIAEYTKKIETTVINKDSTESAIQALILAISCLKRVVVAVKDIALFWHSLEQSCRQLSESSLVDDIKAVQELDKEDRLEVYYDSETMYPLLCYAAKWTAIYSISNAYIKAAEKTRFRLNETVTNSDSVNMSREQHWEEASQLAGQVGERIQLQVEDSRNKTKELEARKTT